MRRSSKSILLIVTGVVVLIVVAVLWPRDVVELEFSTYKQAVAANAFENGALPTWMPKSATNIRSISNLDSNSAVVTFSFGPDFDTYLAAQKSAPAQSAASLGIRQQGDIFADPRELTYIPKIAPDGESHQGALLVNRSHRKALYFQ